MKPTISIIVPTIRPNLWKRFYNSILDSCKKCDWELIFIGPFADESLLSNDCRIKFIKSYSNPTTCFQIGIASAKNSLLYFTSDDSVLYPDALDICVFDFIQFCKTNDVLNVRYREGKNFGQYEFPMAYWIAGSYPHVYGQKFVNRNWGLAIQSICDREFFINFGGFDCRFQFSNHAHADFSFRLQNFGGKVYHSRCEIANLTHIEGETGDHAPVKNAQEIDDTNLFNEIWNNVSDRKIIEFNNYLEFKDKIWSKRFKKEYNSYEEMYQGENYIK
jgi:hypothetical protein